MYTSSANSDLLSTNSDILSANCDTFESDNSQLPRLPTVTTANCDTVSQLAVKNGQLP